ncbi:MAG: hypothetical protein ACI4QG_00805 [Candidatus Cryptobacteroides sp.]
MEHHTSKRHPRMPLSDRAAQFAPFAALTGYEEMIERTGEEEIPGQAGYDDDGAGYDEGDGDGDGNGTICGRP